MRRTSGSFLAPGFRVLSTALALGSFACSILPPPEFTEIRRIRSDGEVVSCQRPPSSWFDTEEAIGTSADFPFLLQEMESSDQLRQKVDRVLRDVDTEETLEVLAFRFCLEYGNGTMSRQAYSQWTDSVLPEAREAVRG